MAIKTRAFITGYGVGTWWLRVELEELKTDKSKIDNLRKIP